jgi:HEAT repeat protein
MPREQLKALAADVDRLLVAGSAVAAGDDKLRQRGKALRELGQKVPALTQIADAVDRVASGNRTQATPALLDLLLIVRQVRGSMAAAGADGFLEPAERSGPWSTTTAVHDVYFLTQTLCAGGSGRVDAVQGVVERQEAADLRLVGLLFAGLDDGFADLADLIATQALPQFGPVVLPELCRGLDLTGTRREARRLLAVCKIDAKKGTDLCRAGLADGSPVVRVQALRCLADVAPADAERAALEMVGQKMPRDLRCAVLAALRSSRNDAALEALLDAAAVNDPEVWYTASEVLRKTPHPHTTQRLVEKLEEAVRALVEAKKPRAERERAEERASRLAQALGERKDREATPALVALLQHADADIRSSALNALTVLEDPAGLEAAADLLDDPKVWRTAVHAAWRLPARQHYDRLAPLCANLSHRGPTQRERGDYVLSFFTRQFHYDPADAEFLAADFPEDDEMDKPRTDWDPRWKQLLLKHLEGPSREEIALALAVVAGTKVVPDLLRVLPASVKSRQHLRQFGVIRALGRLRAREAVAPLVALLDRQKDYLFYYAAEALGQIGDPSAIPALEAALDKFTDLNVRSCIQGAIERLREQAKV